MAYLLTIILFLIVHIIILHRKLQDVSELIQESSLLSQSQEIAQNDEYYLKFVVDKDFKISEVNDDLLKYGKFKAENLIGKNVLGNLLEDVAGNKEFLEDCKRKLKRKKRTFSCEQTLLKANMKSIPVLLRVRPVLNEKLIMKGISFWGYPLNRRIKLEKQLKNIKQKDQISGEIYNAETFVLKLEERVGIAGRRGQKLALIVIEIADVYNFVAKGFSFNSGDKLIRMVAEACVECCGNSAVLGRFDNTKFGLIFENEFSEREKIKETADILLEKIVANIRKLNVDKANAGMVCVFYTSMHRFCDSADNMLSRSRIYLKNSCYCHDYGIGTIDRN